MKNDISSNQCSLFEELDQIPIQELTHEEHAISNLLSINSQTLNAMSPSND